MRRFFFHYNKRTKLMTLHFMAKCMPCKNLVCRVPCETHRNKRQPLLVMRGFAHKVIQIGDTIEIT